MRGARTVCAMMILLATSAAGAPQRAGSAPSAASQERPKERDLGLQNQRDIDLPGTGPTSLDQVGKNSSALLIGISQYQHLPANKQLKFADRDAEGMREFLISKKGRLNQKNVRLLTNENATLEKIILGLFWLKNNVGPTDVALIFFAGHGFVQNGEGFLLAYDFRPGDLSTAYPMRSFNRDVQGIRARAVVMLSDACHSGTMTDMIGQSVQSLTFQNLADHLSRVDQSLFILSAANPNQSSIEVPEYGHGLFTHHLLQALEGNADQHQNADGLVRADELYAYVNNRVREDVERLKREGAIKNQEFNQIPEFNPFYDTSVPLSILNDAALVVYRQWLGADVFSRLETAFDQALSERRVIEPGENCAWYYYHELSRRAEVAAQKGRVEQKRVELLTRLRSEAQSVIDKESRERKEWEQCEDLFRRATQLAPEGADSLRLQARQHYCAGMARLYPDETASAERECESALALIEKHHLDEPFLCVRIAQFFKNLGAASGQKKHWENARRGYKLAVESTPDPELSWRSQYAEALIRLANLAEAQKDLPTAQSLLGEAEKQLRLALDEDPDYLAALKLLGEILRRSDQKARLDEAVRVFEHVLRLDPRDVEIKYRYGQVLLKLGEAKRAIGPLGEVAKQWLTDPARRDDALLHLSQAYAHSGDVGRAISALREAEQRGSQRVEIYDALSQWLYEQGDLESAIAVAKKAASLPQPDGPEKARRLRIVAEFLERTGRLEDAAYQYQEAAEMTAAARVKSALATHAKVLFLRADQPQRAGVVRQPLGPVERPPYTSTSVIVPGGLEALTRLTGVNIQSPDDSRAVARIFDACLRDGALHRRLLTFYDQYFEFIEQVGPGLGGWLELPPPTQTGSSAAKAALKFFGVKDKNGQRKTERKFDESKKLFLRALGGDPERLAAGQPTSINLKEGQLPVLFGWDSWAAKIKDGTKAKAKEQWPAFLKDESAMQLYVGLSLLPEPGAWSTFGLYNQDLKEDMPVGIFFAAPYLRFTSESKVYIPGKRLGEENWKQALNVRRPEEAVRELFKAKNRGALYLWAALSAAGEVGDYIAADSSLFHQFYRSLQTIVALSGREPFDLIDLFSHLRVENDRLRLPSVVESWLKSAQPNVEPVSAMLSQLGSVSAGRSIPFVKQMAVLEQIERERPEWVSEPKQMEVILEQVRAGREPQLELALDLRLEWPQLDQFIQRMKELDALSPPAPKRDARPDPQRDALLEHKRNAIRAFQSAFELLRLMARNGTLTDAEVGKVATRLLKADPASHAFAFDVLAAMKTDLLGLDASASGQEVQSKLIAALATEEPLVFLNRSITGDHSTEDANSAAFYRYDGSSALREHITRGLDTLTHTKLEAVVQAVAALDGLERNPSDGSAIDQLQKAATRFIEPGPPPPPKKKPKHPLPPPPSLKQSAAQLAAPVPADTRRELRRLVAPYVGEALLGLVYATLRGPAGFFGSLPPDLVRRHDFQTEPWGDAVVDPGQTVIRGSVARLSAALAQLESQASRGGGASLHSLPSTWPIAATILNSYRLVDQRSVNPRAAAYVARALDLGEEVLARAYFNDSTVQAVVDRLEEVLSPRRASIVRAYVKQADIKKAIDELTLSELYDLGRRYLEQLGQSQAPSADLIDAPGAVSALAKIISEAAAEPAPARSDLRRGLRQFGLTTRTRTGLARLDLIQVEPYEQALSFRELHRLAERVQDFKLALARAGYRQGRPAPLALNLMLARYTLQGTLAEANKATGGAPLPESDWPEIVSVIERVDQPTLDLFLTQLVNSPHKRDVSPVKWSDEVTPGTTAAVKP